MREHTADIDWERLSPQECLRAAFEAYGDEAALSCSFGGPSGMALLDMAARIRPGVCVVSLDTGFLFAETHDVMRRAAARYDFTLHVARPALSPEEQAEQHGERLWEHAPDLCCRLRKVEPMQAAMAGLKAWITGIRRDQSPTRRDTPVARWDEGFGLMKINPLAAWTERDVWAYIVENDVPYNALHDAGYPSIGCTHCTRAVRPGEGLRAGRWSGHGKTECGLHR